MKRLMASICIISVLVFTISSSEVLADDMGRELLSDMTEYECLDFVKENGVTIPSDYADEYTWAPFVKKVIEIVETEPQYMFGYNYSVTQQFAEDIQEVVNNYYGINIQDAECTEATYTSTYDYYTLQDSSVYCSWVSSYMTYGCYPFALYKTESIQSPGENSGKTFSLSMDISEMVTNIVSDLHYFGYPCVKTTVTRPIIGGLQEGRRAICYRAGTEDYHFMRMGDDAWYHKPTNTLPLKYNYLPVTTRVWTNERVVNMTTREPNTTYDGPIYFFIYSTKHNSYTYIGAGCHKIDCSYCGTYVAYTSCSPVGNCKYCGS